MDKYRYEIQPRAEALGGGWRLLCFESDIEVMGGVFPCSEGESEEAKNEAYSEALAQANEWLESRL